ncbi:MAG: efflux RND transporter periplasmic adaptor subunit [Acidobacteriota bacterium]
MKKLLTRLIYFLIVAGIAALVIIAFLPSPVTVETARPMRGALQVTIDEEGETRAHDRYVIASPVAGRLRRVELDEGDVVSRGAVVAEIEPVPIDVKERIEITARVQAAEAAKREAEAQVQHALADFEQARRERLRAETLAKDGLVSAQMVEQARNLETTSANELEAARQRVLAATSEVKIARTGLIAVEAENNDGNKIVKLTAPVKGQVLSVVEKSERVVASGTPVVIIGDPRRMEIVVDVLSTEAVKIKPGTPVLLEGWGGDQPIKAKVRIVEPAAFKKISALGVEEQRVNVVCDFVDSPGLLGDGYRVEARIIIWEAAKVLKVPASALFRHEQGWSVFVIENNRARRRDVKIGHRSAYEVEILEGISESDELVLHPTNQLTEGAEIERR